MVRIMSMKICRVMPWTKMMGTNTQMVVKVEAVMAPMTSRAPWMAASRGSTPSARSR